MISVKLLTFEGIYKRSGCFLNKQGCEPDTLKLIITYRKQVSRNKASRYLLYSFNGCENTYFSSMYPTDRDGVFHCEHKEKRYSFHLNDNTGKLVKR